MANDDGGRCALEEHFVLRPIEVLVLPRIRVGEKARYRANLHRPEECGIGVEVGMQDNEDQTAFAGARLTDQAREA